MVLFFIFWGMQGALHLLFVEVTHNDEEDHTEADKRQLVAGAQQRGQQNEVGGLPEHIAMHLLPAILITQVALLRVTGKKKKKKGRST